MKRILLISSLLAIWCSQAFSQSTVSLNINHKLAGADFALNVGAKNNMDHDFNVKRLEYYISEISLIHDGGTETLVEDFWILANASEKTEVTLGEFDIVSLEMIKLHIGVDEAHNHLDPTSHPNGHPLAPTAPSMHWGWTPGYRFVAIEGKGGANYNQTYELHGLGDQNYFTTEIEMDLTAEDGLLLIDLDADYTRALENISVNSGVIVHGEFGDAKKCLQNFSDFVFSPAGSLSSNLDFSEVNGFDLFPNPVENFATIKLDLLENNHSYDLTITTVEGKQMQYLQNVSNDQTIDLSNYSSGIYFVNLIKKGQVVIANKIYVK